MGLAFEHLSDAQCERFHREGFLIVERFFDPDEVQMLGRIARADHELGDAGRESPGWRRGCDPSGRPKCAWRRRLQRVRSLPSHCECEGVAAPALSSSWKNGRTAASRDWSLSVAAIAVEAERRSRSRLRLCGRHRLARLLATGNRYSLTSAAVYFTI